jgi:hypothetical protein
MFRKRPSVPEPEAVVLLREAVDLLEEAFGGYGNWTAPTSWVERKAVFLSKYEDATQRATKATETA